MKSSMPPSPPTRIELGDLNEQIFGTLSQVPRASCLYTLAALLQLARATTAAPATVGATRGLARSPGEA